VYANFIVDPLQCACNIPAVLGLADIGADTHFVHDGAHGGLDTSDIDDAIFGHDTPYGGVQYIRCLHID
jgi:hypothetical protein